MSLTSLRIDKVYDWEKDSVENRPYDPEFPSKVLDSNWGDFDDDEVGDPVSRIKRCVLS